MKNRIVYSCKKLTKKLSKSIEKLNLFSKKCIYSKENHTMLRDISYKAYAKGFITESEFISLTEILGKDVSHFNEKGYVEKSIAWFFCEIISDQL